MKTSKPFATISYNTVEFLERKLNELIVKRIIEFWVFVYHFKEEDETKDHIHLYIVPNGQLNTDQVGDYLQEIDGSQPFSLPLGCIRFKPSKFADWYLYSKHDVDYLASKGQARKYQYPLEDFKTSSKDYFLEEIHTIDLSTLNRSKALKTALDNGVSFEQLVTNGQIPIQMIKQYEYAYSIMSSHTYRNGRSSHSPIEDFNLDGNVEIIDTNGVYLGNYNTDDTTT